MQCKNCESTNTRLFDDSGYTYYNVYVCDTCGESFKVEREVITFDDNIRPSATTLNIINEHFDKEDEIKPQYAIRTQNKWKLKDGSFINWLDRKQTPETFIGLSDGIPDCYVSVEEEDGIKFLTMQEDCNTATLKLDKEAIEHLKLIIEWLEQNEK